MACVGLLPLHRIALKVEPRICGFAERYRSSRFSNRHQFIAAAGLLGASFALHCVNTPVDSDLSRSRSAR